MEEISKLIRRHIRKGQIGTPTDFRHTDHLTPRDAEEMEDILMGRLPASPIAEVSANNLGRPLPPLPSGPDLYAEIGPAYENFDRSLRDAVPSGEELTKGRVIMRLKRTPSGHLESLVIDDPDVPPPVPPHARPPVPPHAPRPTAPTSTLHAAPPPSELAHEPQVLAYPRGRIGSSSMPAAAPEEIAGASRFQGWSHHWRGLMSDAADGVIL